ncbi:MarR family winged helix-turn-helix transcriptional regulator [Leifsonia sp. LS-T14]|uniref:MarR family winged helix-turn-helix transcriptional regulator n=1 Tax=unclassified Leifsonia TaxID=2663824 RepID=UPI0035A632A0
MRDRGQDVVGAEVVGAEVVEALRAFSVAEAALRRRSKGARRRSENDIAAMRYLLRAHEAGRSVRPKELGEYLGIQSSSVTALLDRLEKAGRIRRESSPVDRRALVVVPTIPEDERQRATIGDVRPELAEVAASLGPEQARIVLGFLRRMRDTADAIDLD